LEAHPQHEKLVNCEIGDPSRPWKENLDPAALEAGSRSQTTPTNHPWPLEERSIFSVDFVAEREDVAGKYHGETAMPGRNVPHVQIGYQPILQTVFVPPVFSFLLCL
jgi:hypothetical protein